jgi:hypothetical protein
VPSLPRGRTPDAVLGKANLIDQATTEAILRKHIEEHGDLPPFIERLLAAYGYKLER